MPLLILTTSGGKKVSLNPSYITSIEPVEVETFKIGCKSEHYSDLWVVSHAGYGTKSHRFTETVEELTELINTHIEENSK